MDGYFKYISCFWRFQHLYHLTLISYVLFTSTIVRRIFNLKECNNNCILFKVNQLQSINVSISHVVSFALLI